MPSPTFDAVEDPSRFREFPPVGRCIYCGSADPPGGLSMEHIVPRGLGGNFELPAASCADCAATTSYIEGVCLRGPFHHARARLGLLSRKRKREHPTHFSADIDFGTRTAPRQIPVARFPTFLTMMRYGPPTAPFNLPPTEFAVSVSIAAILTKEHYFDLHSEHSITVRTNLNLTMYDRLLAKIGHAYATAALGVDKFTPLLSDFIRFGVDTDDPRPMRHLIGGDVQITQPAQTLHEISLQKWQDYLVVKMRLFASFDMPVYYIVAGRL